MFLFVYYFFLDCFFERESKEGKESCIILGIVRTYVFLVSFMWTLVIAWRVYLIVKGTYNNKKAMPILYLHALCGIPPAIYVTLIGLFQLYLGKTIFGWNDVTQFCWFTDLPFEIPLFFGPSLIVFLLVFILYIIIIYKLRTLNPSIRGAMQNRILFLPLVFLICLLPKLVKDIYFVLGGQNEPPLDTGVKVSLEILDSFFLNLQGFLNSIIFILSPTIRTYYYQWICLRGTRNEDISQSLAYTDTT